MRLRTAVFDKLCDVDDADMSRNLCAKTLMYVLRIALAAVIYYKRTEYGIEKESMMHIGKQTLSRLLRHLDFLHILPPDEVGVIRPSYLITTSVYIPTTSYETTVLTRQMNVIRNFLSRCRQAYVIYLSSWGACSQVSLPVLNVILERSNSELENRITDYYSPFNFETLPVRFAQGVVQDLGRIWHYQRVPIGASISPDEDYIMPPVAGTLGVYLRDPVDAGSKYALTAGHVARDNAAYNNVGIYAPASRPYREAKKSLDIALSRALKCDNEKLRNNTESSLQKLSNVERKFGDIVFTTMETSQTPPYLKEDVCLIKVTDSRGADNCLRKVPAYGTNHTFEEGADLPTEIASPDAGLSVAKVGIRTGYTTGTIGTPAYVRWRRSITQTVPREADDYTSFNDSLVHVIHGNEGQLFADQGDSGSLIVHLEAEEGGPVTQTQAVGLVTSLVLEDPPVPSVVIFYPMKVALAKVSTEVGKSLVIDDRVREEDVWEYVQ